MGRQDASRSIEIQMLAPWDSQTAAHKPGSTKDLAKALSEWETRRGMRVSLRDCMQADISGAIARRKLIGGNDYIPDSEEE